MAAQEICRGEPRVRPKQGADTRSAPTCIIVIFGAESKASFSKGGGRRSLTEDLQQFAINHKDAQRGQGQILSQLRGQLLWKRSLRGHLAKQASHTESDQYKSSDKSCMFAEFAAYTFAQKRAAQCHRKGNETD